MKKAVELDPKNGHARYLLASAYIQQNDAETAIALLSQSVELLPEDARIKKLYAQILFHVGRREQAVEVLRIQMPLLDEEPEYHALLAAIYQDMKQHRQSVEIYHSLVSLRPDQSIWWMGLGISHEALGNQSEALSAYQQAMQGGELSNSLKRYVGKRIQTLTDEKRT